MTDEPLYRNTRVMTIGTGVSRATGLLRTVAMVYALGVTSRPGYPSRGHGLILIFLQRADST